jgi:hypothetical protein
VLPRKLSSNTPTCSLFTQSMSIPVPAFERGPRVWKPLPPLLLLRSACTCQ